MDSFELSVVINRPAEEVFAVLANLENDIKWRTEWIETKNTSESPPGMGATYRLVSEFLGRQIPTVYEVIEYEPDRRAAWKTMSGPLPLTFRRTFEHVEGGTHFTIRYEVEPRGFFKLVMPLLSKSVKRQHQDDLHRVKELLETRAL